ncbi:FUN14 domain-containing protein 2 [Hemicordylus capensis]|uniref:FUN14 domain-containing protein 2 n=1 Tax=Hemicordylus capensis TaxID=884348 RepID=UPI002302D415|nr:FUN14 domain-containing protein 2 [Hemicordylus capensis]
MRMGTETHWPPANMEDEEEEEEGPLVPSPRASATHSCSSLIRLKQEAKRKRQGKQRKAVAMPVTSDSDDILDLAKFTKKQPWWRKLFGSTSGSNEEKYNVATQLAIGGAIGWCTGFIFQKVGKLAATAVGGGFFLLQMANHTGYIKIDWKMVERDVSKAKEQLTLQGGSSKQLAPEVKNRVNEVVAFLKTNVVLAGGFAGGFLLGMAS